MFLATLVVLLSVSAVIVFRSLVLWRRRRMVEEAIRNGTWVPPSPPSRVDLSKKPVLWEAYIDAKGSVSYPHGGIARGKSIDLDWMMEQSKDWDVMKPISAAYLMSSTASIPLVQIPTNVSVSSAATPTPPTPNQAIFSQAMRMLIPMPVQPSPPGPANSSSVNINASARRSETGDAHISMEGLDQKRKSPSLMTVAVLIAMPSPPTSSSSSSLSAAVPLSVPLPMNASSPSSPQTSPSMSPPTTVTQSHPLQINPPFPLPLPSAEGEEEHRIPHVEVGVAEVLVVLPDSVTHDEGSHMKRKLRETPTHPPLPFFLQKPGFEATTLSQLSFGHTTPFAGRRI